MKTLVSHLIYIIVLLFLSSCEEVIDLDLKDDTGKLVIEGVISDLPGGQTITLSKNVPFSNANSYPPVTGAQVYVREGAGNSYVFTEGPAGTYTNAQITGIMGLTYSLTVVTDNTTFTASSKMPSLVKLDSLTSRKDIFESDDDTRIISVHYQDPAGIANQYRFIVHVNDSLVKRVFVNNDQFSDGRYVEFDLPLDNDEVNIHPGDKVAVEMECIDKPIYTYWYSLSSYGWGGSATPANPPTNIMPKSLGYFSAHTTELGTIIVK